MNAAIILDTLEISLHATNLPIITRCLAARVQLLFVLYSAI